MSKINLIIGREYWTRVKSKTFLLTTFLAPLGIVLIYAVLGYLMTRGSDKVKNITIIDKAGLTENVELEKENLIFSISNLTLEDEIARYEKGEIDGILELPSLDSSQSSYSMVYHSDKILALDESSSVRSMFRKEIRNFKIKAFGIDQNSLDLIDTDITVEPKTIKDKEKEISSITSAVSSGLGLVVGVLLFFVIFMFGQQVMRGVNEEKINRIVEVLISSVKPLELMIGKVVGIGLVGLTQFAIWAIIMTALSVAATTFFGIDTTGVSDLANNEAAAEIMSDDATKQKIANVIKELFAINWLLIIPLYFFYFIIGYLIYASLFAAVGAAAGDDINEAQALTMIAMMPLMAAFYIAISAAQAPDSTLSVWSSIIPFTAPVVMPVRLASNPPMWQIWVSILLSILCVVFMIWLASRIYRVGILMYGKKASFKELGKWIFTKG